MVNARYGNYCGRTWTRCVCSVVCALRTILHKFCRDKDINTYHAWCSIHSPYIRSYILKCPDLIVTYLIKHSNDQAMIGNRRTKIILLHFQCYAFYAENHDAHHFFSKTSRIHVFGKTGELAAGHSHLRPLPATRFTKK